MPIKRPGRRHAPGKRARLANQAQLLRISLLTRRRQGPAGGGMVWGALSYEAADLDVWAQSRFTAAADVCADLGIDRLTLGRRVRGRIRGEAERANDLIPCVNRLEGGRFRPEVMLADPDGDVYGAAAKVFVFRPRNSLAEAMAVARDITGATGAIHRLKSPCGTSRRRTW